MGIIKNISSLGWIADIFYKPKTIFRRVLALFAGHAELLPGNSHELAIVIPLTDKVLLKTLKMQAEIYRRFGYNTALEGAPHITLKLGFQYSEVRRLEKYLEELAAETEPIPVTMKRHGFFDEHQICHVDVVKNLALEALQRRIISDLQSHFDIRPYPIEEQGFEFHITISRGHSRREFDEIRRTHADVPLDLAYTARHIELLNHIGGRWVPIWSATFQKSP